MNLAQRFLTAWHSQTKTISASALALRLDPSVHIKTAKSHGAKRTYYRFIDNSQVITTGRGRNFRILHPKEQTQDQTQDQVPCATVTSLT